MEVSFRGKLLTFLYFPDITQEEAVIDKKNYLIKLVTVEMYALSTSFEHITTEELETTGCIEMKETQDESSSGLTIGKYILPLGCSSLLVLIG